MLRHATRGEIRIYKYIDERLYVALSARVAPPRRSSGLVDAGVLKRRLRGRHCLRGRSRTGLVSLSRRRELWRVLLDGERPWVAKRRKTREHRNSLAFPSLPVSAVLLCVGGLLELC